MFVKDLNGPIGQRLHQIDRQAWADSGVTISMSRMGIGFLSNAKE
jgi:hypothetical protein